MRISPSIIHPTSIQDLLSSWVQLSPFLLSKKPLLQAAWNWILKAICWKIWKERNSQIFRGKESHPSRVVAQARAIVGEALEQNSALANNVPLKSEESHWLAQFVPNHHIRTPSNALLANWEIRLDENAFNSWKLARNASCLFFDGAAKGNPGLSGCGGVITEANGKLISSYAWGLGNGTNNKAEFCRLYQGLRIARTKGIANLLVFGDSQLLIQAISNKKRPSNVQLAQIMKRIRTLYEDFHSISFYHILRNLNSMADKAVNEGARLCRGILHMDGIEIRWDVP